MTTKFLLAAVGVCTIAVPAAGLFVQGSPLTKVLSLLGDLRASVEADAKREQRDYDKYACWCEDTLASKVKEISGTKEQIEALQRQTTDLGACVASHGVSIKQLKKDIVANEQSQQEATEIRSKEHQGFQEDTAEFEQCLGAVEAALGVLSGAGGRTRFLETLQEAQLLSAVAGVRGMLNRPAVAKAVGEEGIKVVQHFVQRPEDFIGSRSSMLSAAQIAANPFGDYSPQSTQIQGILKGMYDSFEKELEKAHTVESQRKKAFQDLMATKQAELGTLQATLVRQEAEEADKAERFAQGKSALRDAKEQLAAAETFFAEAKDTCKVKAQEMAQRTSLRTEELHGLSQAVSILSGDTAKSIFGNASSLLFLQLSSGGEQLDDSRYEKAYHGLSDFASKAGNAQLARLAERARKGYFDEVIATIDHIVAMLQREEQQDIEERDLCERKQLKNKHNVEDLNYDIKKAQDSIKRFETEVADAQVKVDALQADINRTQISLQQMKDMVARENDDMIQAMSETARAIRLLEEAIDLLSKLYRRNGISVGLLQQSSSRSSPLLGAPVDPFRGEYTGRKEAGGILAILRMVKEDYEQDLARLNRDGGVAQARLVQDQSALQHTLDAYMASKAVAERELANFAAKVADLEDTESAKNRDLTAEQQVTTDLNKLCAWVGTHFDSRREKRKAEVEALARAKNYLLGLEEDQETSDGLD